jgi:hypothetical protein
MPERRRMHWVTSLNIVSADPGAINTEAHACAKTRQPAASIQSFERSDKGFPSGPILDASRAVPRLLL